MSEETSKKEVRFEATVIEANELYDLRAVASYSETEPDLIRHYCAIGLISPARRGERDDLFFDDDGIYWLRQIRELRRDAGISQRGLRVILELRREIEQLKKELRFRMES